jgi:hypothetical protein
MRICEIGADRLQPFLTWLIQNRAKGFVGELGIPGNDPRWLPVLDNFLTCVARLWVVGSLFELCVSFSNRPVLVAGVSCASCYTN